MSKQKYAEQEKKSVDPSFFESHRPEPLSRFIYNRKEGTVLGRNFESWGKIMLDITKQTSLQSKAREIVKSFHKFRKFVNC